MLEFVFDRFENIVEKGENAGYHNYILFLQCFKRLLYQSPLKMELYGTVLLSFVHTKMCRVAIGLIRSKEIKIGPSAISKVYNNLIFLGLSHSTFTKQFHGCTILKEKYFDNNGTIFLVIHISFFHQFSSTMVKDKFHNFNHTQYGLYSLPNTKF